MGAILSLLDGFAVMRGMAHNQEKRDPCGYEREYAANNLAQLVKGNAAIPQVCLFNCGLRLLSANDLERADQELEAY